MKKQYQSDKEGKPIKDVKINPDNNTGRNKVVVTGDSVVKYLKPNDLTSRENFAKVSTQLGAATENMLDYFEPVVRKKPDIVIIHTGTTDLTNGVKTMNKVKKLVQYIRQNDKDKSTETGFSSICYRADRDLEKEFNDINGRLKNYCSGNGFIFVDNSTINEFCLNKSKFHLNKKGTNMLANNIKSSLTLIRMGFLGVRFGVG